MLIEISTFYFFFLRHFDNFNDNDCETYPHMITTGMLMYEHIKGNSIKHLPLEFHFTSKSLSLYLRRGVNEHQLTFLIFTEYDKPNTFFLHNAWPSWVTEQLIS